MSRQRLDPTGWEGGRGSAGRVNGNAERLDALASDELPLEALLVLAGGEAQLSSRQIIGG